MRYLGLGIAILALVFLFAQLEYINPSAVQNDEIQLELITAENAHLIQQLDPIGYGKIREFLFSPDGRWLAVRTVTSVLLYNTQNWSDEPRLLRVLDKSSAFVFSPDSQNLAITGCRGNVTDVYHSHDSYCEITETQVWNLTDFNLVPHSYHHGQASVRGLFYMLFDNEPLPVLVLVTERGLMLYQNAREQIYLNDSARISYVAISPDLRTLVSYSNGASLQATRYQQWPQQFSEWSSGFSTTIQNYPQIWGFQLSRNGQYFILRGFDTNYIWNLQENQLEQVEGNEIISPNMAYTIHRSENRYEIWNYPSDFLDDSQRITTLPLDYGTSELSFSPDSSYVIMGNSFLSGTNAETSQILIWDIEEEKPKAVLEGNAYLYRFSPDMHLFAFTDENYQVQIYDLEREENIASLSGYALETYGAAFNQQGEAVYLSCASYYAVGEGLSCLQSSLHLGQESFPIPLSLSSSSLVLSPDNRYAILIAYPILLWDIENQRSVAELERTWTYNASFNPDSHMFATSGSPARVYSFGEDETVNILYSLGEENDLRVNDIVFNPDGSLIATAQSDGTSRLYVSESGIQLATLWSNQELKDGSDWTNVDAVAFSPDGQWLASSVCIWTDGSAASNCLESKIQVWNVAEALDKGELLATEDARILDWVSDYSNRLVFSPNGELLVATGQGRTVEFSGNQGLYVWDVQSGELLNILSVNATTQVTFSADGRTLIGNSLDGVIYRWGIPRIE